MGLPQQAAGAADWERALGEQAEAVKDRDLPSVLKGRNPEAIALLRLLQALEIYDRVLNGLLSAFKYDRTYFDKIVSSVGPLMEKLNTGPVAALISPDYLNEADPRPMFEGLEVIRGNGVVYVGLGAPTDTTVASAVGNSMFAHPVSVAGHLDRHGVTGEGAARLSTVSLHADELNELIGEELVRLLNTAGGAGFQPTASTTQTWSDVGPRIGSRAKAGQMAGNFNTLVRLRLKELATADRLTEQRPRDEVLEPDERLRGGGRLGPRLGRRSRVAERSSLERHRGAAALPHGPRQPAEG